MRFIVVSAPSMEKLAELLNTTAMGTGRVISVVKSGKLFQALVDTYPTHVLTNDDILVEFEDMVDKGVKVVLAA